VAEVLDALNLRLGTELLADGRVNDELGRPFSTPHDTLLGSGVAEVLDALNLRLGTELLADGRVYVGTTRYRGLVAFRPAIVNWRTTEADVDSIVDVVRELGARIGAKAAV